MAWVSGPAQPGLSWPCPLPQSCANPTLHHLTPQVFFRDARVFTRKPFPFIIAQFLFALVSWGPHTTVCTIIMYWQAHFKAQAAAFFATYLVRLFLCDPVRPHLPCVQNVTGGCSKDGRKMLKRPLPS